MKAALLNLERFALLAGLQSDGDADFLRCFFKDFFKNAETRMASLSQAIDALDSERLGAEAHALNSSCLNAGADRMSELVETFEQLGKSATSLEKTPALYAQLRFEYSCFKSEILSKVPGLT